MSQEKGVQARTSFSKGSELWRYMLRAAVPSGPECLAQSAGGGGVCPGGGLGRRTPPQSWYFNFGARYK